MLNRRGFLAMLTAAFVADPERLLWIPGKKLISVPKPYFPPYVSEAEIIASRMAFVRPGLEKLVWVSSPLWKLIEEEVSSPLWRPEEDGPRPVRVPFQVNYA